MLYIEEGVKRGLEKIQKLEREVEESRKENRRIMDKREGSCKELLGRLKENQNFIEGVKVIEKDLEKANIEKKRLEEFLCQLQEENKKRDCYRTWRSQENYLKIISLIHKREKISYHSHDIEQLQSQIKCNSQLIRDLSEKLSKKNLKIHEISSEINSIPSSISSILTKIKLL